MQIQTEAGLSIQYQPAPASIGLLRPASTWIYKKKKSFVFWLSGPHGTSFDHQSLIHSDRNYTYLHWQKMLKKLTIKVDLFVVLIFGSSHIWSVLIGVKYWNCCQTFIVYLRFALQMGQIQSKLIYIFVTYWLASL